MKLKDFDYILPKALIAQKPIKPRDHSRLLVLNKKTNKIEHKHFYNIEDYLNKGDVLVLNNSKVFPARLIGKKVETGGKVEVFLLQPSLPASLPPLAARREGGANLKQLNRLSSSPLSHDPALAGNGVGGGGSVWSCLIGGRGSREGLEVKLNPESSGLKCKVVKDNKDGTWEIEFNKTYIETMEIIEKIGQVPLPPYIKRKSRDSTAPALLRDAIGRVVSLQNDKIGYQTVYADAKKIGSVAAPTAGFHFTPRLINKLKKKGVEIEYITLHVGLGTFAPVKTENIKNHKMHSELIEIKKGAAQRIIKAKKERRRIIAVGTTSVRTLEGCLSSQINCPTKKIVNRKSSIENFIYPGYKFKIVDAMITNFHLPKSTLLMLVSAFADKKKIDSAYKEAIKKKYRFYSYGDAMYMY